MSGPNRKRPTREDRRRHLARGVWGVLATPFEDSTLAVDHQSLAKQVNHYVELGVSGVVALGVFGEAARLSSSEQTAVIDTVLESAGKLPIVIGLAPLATAPAVEQATALTSRGRQPAGLLTLVNSQHASDLTNHFRAIYESTGVGIVAQDYPVQSGVQISAHALADVVQASDCVVAVKSEAPPTAVTIASLVNRVDTPVFGGLGGVGLIDELAAGAAGAMTGFSHPEGLLRAVESFAEGGFEEARDAWQPWLPLANFEGQPGVGLAIRKEILKRRGLISGSAVRPPGLSLPREVAHLIDRHLSALSSGAL